MTRVHTVPSLAVLSLVLAVAAAPAAHAALHPDGAGEPQSPRLEQAKDLIADEQWGRAIEVLKAAAGDARERNKDEALFWLAHSQNNARDLAAAIQTISTLESQFPKSRWIRPAGSLRIEIAQKLGQSEVLWWTAQRRLDLKTNEAAAPPSERPRTITKTPTARGTSPARSAATTPPAPAEAPVRPAQGRATTVTVAGERAPNTAAPPAMWIPQSWSPDANHRIQALGSLMETDAVRVMPILKEIALESPDPQEARRAVFVLAQSGKPEAYSVVVEVAKHGSELVQLAAVRELGRFGGPKVSEELLKVYSSGNPRVKYQVVNSLGERSATAALMRIAETESDRRLQETAIVRLGQAGARDELQRFYSRARTELKRPIIIGLFNARAEDELIRIIEQEKNADIRREALTRLRLLDTAKAKAAAERFMRQDVKKQSERR